VGLYGTEEQKRVHLTAIAEGREKWAIGFTEPGGGTDLLTSGCTSWYLDKHGRPNTFPGTPAEHRALLTEPELAHFEVSTPVVEPSVQR
jgi:hypothetical protein